MFVLFAFSTLIWAWEWLTSHTLLKYECKNTTLDTTLLVTEQPMFLCSNWSDATFDVRPIRSDNVFLMAAYVELYIILKI